MSSICFGNRSIGGSSGLSVLDAMFIPCLSLCLLSKRRFGWDPRILQTSGILAAISRRIPRSLGKSQCI